ncbi:aminotransferase [Rhizobium herbae]|uniref:4-aminobutyrate aminotransferase-like enzyme/Ser/Thr protein kinase RdoA (MazF antagonist) n=1 Tax=Rhizobium herbae TaxID=508661 RepID=A0ABS4EQF7_9HYPH|nr:aminotransferase [Rhizobium herbae]MBP1860163.1 4-aminobutyrate aminotransferase-like enzyme/Ser/Thr protein kinase RdoA (MazF antagonist) [Rhizobium herbae]
MEHAFLRRAELSRPEVNAEDTARLFAVHYGLSGPIVELGSQQDRNYRIDAANGRFVLKICRSDYATIELEAQNAALRHIAGKPGMPRVPRVIAAVDGADIVFAKVRGQDYQIRLLDYIEGEPLTRRKHLPPVTIAALGALGGRLALALSDFIHPGLSRDLQWDLRHAEPVVRHLLSAVNDADRKERITRAMDTAMQRLDALKPELRLQAIHHDVTDDNVVSQPNDHGQLIPNGVIDFGDSMNGWLAADLAVTCASLLHHADGDPFVILPAIKAFHAVFPLNDAELQALWPLIVARSAVLVASSEQQLALDPDNPYVSGNIDHERMIFDVAVSVPPALMETAIVQSVGYSIAPATPIAGGLLLPGIDLAQVATIALDTQSPLFDGVPWPELELEVSALQNACGEHALTATRYGEYRLTRTVLLSPKPADTFALHVDLLLPAGTSVVAPFDGILKFTDNGLVLVGEDAALHLTGIETLPSLETVVGRGKPLGAVAGAQGEKGMLRVQLCRDKEIVPPSFVSPGHAAAWAALCPSPARLLGFDCDAPAPGSSALLARRQSHFAKPQKNYYETPPQIERGWREHMVDVEGRAYLDMVNNVTILGHGHPRLADAVHRQWQRLNTNSRFHYASVAEFSERLAALAPDGLDTVFLVNSGSEANDLALRLAWAATGARSMLCLLEGYHGWSVASDAVSTSIADNPQALTTRPDWVHPVMSPNTYRGPFRGPGSTADYVATVAPVLEKLDRDGKRLAGFICECVYGNAGGIPLPPGYLKDVYAMVRARGGVCIADEVQVGYGRLGHHFWGFEEQGVTPDIITIAKGMGNGHPLGAVITTRAIADALEKEGYFFSSAGGSPVSSVVGLTVLDIMRDEGLQENARIVGGHLKRRLEALGQRFPLVGAVHGMGLYLGLEFVRDRETLTPATLETAAICDRLLQLGVLMQPTGDHLNVLKIKPPLCLSRQSADFFADMLERVLSEGW